MVEDAISLYLVTYYRESAEKPFKPSGVIVQQAGTDRFEYEIDDIGCAKIAEHYIRLMQSGQCIVPQKNPNHTFIASLKYHMGNRDYSQYDASCKLGTIFQVIGDPVQVLKEKYALHVKGHHQTNSVN